MKYYSVFEFIIFFRFFFSLILTYLSRDQCFGFFLFCSRLLHIFHFIVRLPESLPVGHPRYIIIKSDSHQNITLIRPPITLTYYRITRRFIHKNITSLVHHCLSHIFQYRVFIYNVHPPHHTLCTINQSNKVRFFLS